MAMITRQWVLAILGHLPVYWWPVFLFELCALKQWLATGPVEPGVMLVFGVTPQGRIMLDGFYPPSRANPPEWTADAARSPWARLALDAIWMPGLKTPSRHRRDTVETPRRDLACTLGTSLRPFAPS